MIGIFIIVIAVSLIALFGPKDENRFFGRYLTDYRERGIISPRIRLTSVVTLWLFIGVSAFFLASRLWAVVLLLLVAGAVTVHLYSLPAEARDNSAA